MYARIFDRLQLFNFLPRGFLTILHQPLRHIVRYIHLNFPLLAIIQLAAWFVTQHVVTDRGLDLCRSTLGDGLHRQRAASGHQYERTPCSHIQVFLQLGVDASRVQGLALHLARPACGEAVSELHVGEFGHALPAHGVVSFSRWFDVIEFYLLIMICKFMCTWRNIYMTWWVTFKK